MNIDKAVSVACAEPTLLDALTWIAIWECERAIKQAKNNPTWETCFKRALDQVLKQYQARQGPSATAAGGANERRRKKIFKV